MARYCICNFPHFIRKDRVTKCLDLCKNIAYNVCSPIFFRLNYLRRLVVLVFFLTCIIFPSCSQVCWRSLSLLCNIQKQATEKCKFVKVPPCNNIPFSSSKNIVFYLLYSREVSNEWISYWTLVTWRNCLTSFDLSIYSYVSAQRHRSEHRNKTKINTYIIFFSFV